MAATKDKKESQTVVGPKEPKGRAEALQTLARETLKLKDLSAMMRPVHTALLDGRIVVHPDGSVTFPKAGPPPGPAERPAEPVPPPTPVAEPEAELLEPEPDPEPIEWVDTRPPVPEADYLGLNAVSYWYRNRGESESYQAFLAAYSRERLPGETLGGW
ncbi:MAG: hypothetical protein K2X87_30855 [Gemmataceae bacterium]|nr:hypothetical protein [Gemmataceae bacterium]